jgi:hypothetical protein
MNVSEIIGRKRRLPTGGEYALGRPTTMAPLAGLGLVAAVVVALGASGLPTQLDRPIVDRGEVTAREVASDGTKEKALASYARMPLSFVPNAGQTDSKVRYYVQGAGYGFYFTPQAAVLALTKGAEGKEQGAALHLRFAGANSTPRIEGIQAGSGTVNYAVGRDPADWRTALPTYRGVAYRDLWPGIDMVFRGENGKLKYEFRLEPGADPSKIRLAYAGAESLAVSNAGSLLIDTPLGVLTDARPRTYQRIGGRRVPVESRYLLNPSAGTKQDYAFSLGAFDQRQPLVIDPGLAYSTFLGGTGSDTAFSNVVDDDGNVYVAGFTTSLDFPTTPGAFNVSSNGAFDGFVTKLNDEGSALVYSTYLGGSEFDFIQDIDVDERGNAYVVGFTDSSDYPTTPGAFQEADPGPGPSLEGDDGFVTKLNRRGSGLAYSTYLGGAGEDTANGIRVDEEGYAYVGSSGETSSFPTTPGAFQESDPGPGDVQDAILSKLNPRGSALVFATYLGSTQCDILNTMTVDEDGHIFAAGATGSSDFPTTPGAFQPTEPGAGPGPPQPDGCDRDDGWVAKLNRSGSDLVFSTYIGGSGDEEGVIGIGVDDDGSAFVGGRTDSALDFPTTPAAYDTTYNGGFNDVFVTKFRRSGSALVYSTFLGGSGTEDGSRFNVALDEDGRASLTGLTDSVDFPTTPDAFQPAKSGGLDGYVTTLNRSGDALVYSTFLGGSGTEIGQGISVDEDGALYVSGRTGSANFPITAGAYDTTFNGGGRDAFVTKFDPTDNGDDD